MTALPRPCAKSLPKSAATFRFSPSPRSVMPPSTSSLSPVGLRLVRRLTTPAIASEPYTADAPPVMISTLSNSALEIVFRSTAPSVSEG